MLNVLDRFFTDHLSLAESHHPAETIRINTRIKVHVYHDDPYFLSIFYIDNIPVLQEVMINDLWTYLRQTKRNENLHSFLIEYAKGAV